MIQLLNDSYTEKISDNVLQFSTKQKEFDIIWFADVHLDNPKSKVAFLHKTLQENPKAYIIFGGDNHDLMQSKLDKRSDKEDLKYNKSDYWNELIKHTRAEIIEPYKNRIICWNRGNHETSVLRHLEFDYLDALLDYGNHGLSLYTRGWIIITYSLTKDNVSFSYPIFFQHIPPSGGKRSKGMLSVDLLLAENPDAKAIITEHIHQTWIHPATVERINIKTKQLYNQNVWMIQAPSLKNEQEGKKMGYYHEKIKGGAMTIGAIKLSFFVTRTENDGRKFNMIPSYLFHS